MTSYASLPEPSPIITIEDFLKFKEFFYRRTGISFEASKRYFVDKRLVERIAATLPCCVSRHRARNCNSSPTS
jgi:hypothetical protein